MLSSPFDETWSDRRGPQISYEPLGPSSTRSAHSGYWPLARYLVAPVGKSPEVLPRFCRRFAEHYQTLRRYVTRLCVLLSETCCYHAISLTSMLSTCYLYDALKGRRGANGRHSRF